MDDNQLRHDPIQGKIVHLYDDIEEADNRLPNWWLITLFASIVFGFGYWMVYQSLSFGKNPGDAYQAERMKALDKGGPVDAATLEKLAADPGIVEQGAKVFANNCVTCHGPNGSGKVGPNLTDDAWLHGGNADQIFSTVMQGVTGKGMQAWAPVLGTGGVKQVVAYVVTLRGKNLPGKPPEGTPWLKP